MHMTQIIKRAREQFDEKIGTGAGKGVEGGVVADKEVEGGE